MQINMMYILFHIYCSTAAYIPAGATALSGVYFGEGNRTVHLNYIRCYGTEYNLTECETASNTGLISHSEEVGVMCQPGNEI